MHVVVLGSGFAGIRVAKGLEGSAEVTIVSPTDRFVYLPLIHEMLAERQGPRDCTKPIAEIAPKARHIHDRAVAVDGDEVVLAGGDRVTFDRLVVAIGAEPNDFGLPGVRQNTYSFYSVKDALLANAALKVAVAETGDRPIRLAVAGASFTGIEVAAEAADLLDRLGAEHEIVLLDALPDIFPHQSDAFRDAVREGIDALGMTLRTEQRIEQVQPGKVHIAGQEPVDADVVFWCAGARPRHLEGLRMEVRPTLQSKHRDDVFILGDAARFPPSMEVPRLAQTAEQQAPVAVHNILHPDDPRTYTCKVKGLIISLGHKNAVAEIGGQVLTGAVPWHVKRQLYKAKIRFA